LPGCGTEVNYASDKIRIVCTTFPQYDWVCELLGENADEYDIKLLNSTGVDMHSYQPSVADIASIASCDVFIYVGGESDSWAESALKEAINPDMTVVNMMEVLGDDVKEEETVEGMQQERGSHDHDEETEYDEHVWLSLKNAKVLVKHIAKVLEEKCENHKADIQKNEREYMGKLTELDNSYEKVVSNAAVDTLIFCDRFPFRYLTDDYGIKYYAAFSGCSSETSASFETIVFLSEKIKELGITSVILIDNSGTQVANTVAANAGVENLQLLTMDSMQSVTAKDIENGYTYLNCMEKNLEVMHRALAQCK
jgi:zinc transport system substrate-binding protein